MKWRPGLRTLDRPHPNGRQPWSITPSAEPPGRASSALDWRGRQVLWRNSIFICHTYIARTLVVNDQTSKCKNRKFVVVKELYETWKASWNNIKHFLHFFEAVLTVYKSTLNNACVRSYYYTNSILVIPQPRPQGLLLDDFQNGGGEGPGDEVGHSILVRMAALLLVSTKNRDSWCCKRSSASGDEKGGKARTRTALDAGNFRGSRFSKRNEMNNHVLKWKYPVSQQSASSMR